MDEKDDLCKVWLANILILINREMELCAEMLRAEEKRTSLRTCHRTLFLPINAIRFAFSLPVTFPFSRNSITIFHPWQKPSWLLSLVLRHISRHCDICTQRELNDCFSPSLEPAPVGWSLITMEWAANGVCTAPQPTPPPPVPSAPPLDLHGDL